MTGTEIVHVTVVYKKNAWDITAIYAVPEQTLREAEFWKAQTKNPSATDLKDWLLKNGAKLDCPDGPAYIACQAYGLTHKSYYRDGQRHRQDGPAIIEIWPGGSGSAMFYENGKFIKREPLAPLSAIPGVSIRKTPRNPKL